MVRQLVRGWEQCAPRSDREQLCQLSASSRPRALAIYSPAVVVCGRSLWEFCRLLPSALPRSLCSFPSSPLVSKTFPLQHFHAQLFHYLHLFTICHHNGVPLHALFRTISAFKGLSSVVFASFCFILPCYCRQASQKTSLNEQCSSGAPKSEEVLIRNTSHLSLLILPFFYSISKPSGFMFSLPD